MSPPVATTVCQSQIERKKIILDTWKGLWNGWAKLGWKELLGRIVQAYGSPCDDRALNQASGKGIGEQLPAGIRADDKAINRSHEESDRPKKIRNAAGGLEHLANQQDNLIGHGFKGETEPDDIAKPDEERYENHQRWFDVWGHIDASCIRDVHSLAK